jgi:hypothetical protein
MVQVASNLDLKNIGGRAPSEAYSLYLGKGYMRDIRNMVISPSGPREVEVKQVSWKMKPYDDPIFGENTELWNPAWEPLIPMEKPLSDMLGYWRTHF